MQRGQIILGEENGKEFNEVYKKIKKTLDKALPTMKKISFSAFTLHVSNNDYVNLDDKHCYHGQMAAQAILKDIDNYFMKNQGSVKSKILSSQSDLASRREMAALDKELYRLKQIKDNKPKKYSEYK